MRKPRNILIVMLVAVALCADRAAASTTPSSRAHIGPLTRHVVGQLTRRLQRVIPAPKMIENRRDGVSRFPWRQALPETPSGLHVCQSTPFRFRLPPPVL